MCERYQVNKLKINSLNVSRLSFCVFHGLSAAEKSHFQPLPVLTIFRHTETTEYELLDG